MGSIIDFTEKKKARRKAAERRVIADREERVTRIKQAIERINEVMQETREENAEKGLYLRKTKPESE